MSAKGKTRGIIVQLFAEVKTLKAGREFFARGDLKGQDDRGSFSVEASTVVPIVILFITFLLYLNIRIYAKTCGYTETVYEEGADCAEVHRAVSSIYDAGGDIYEMLFGSD